MGGEVVSVVSDRTLNRTLWVRQQLVAGQRRAELDDPIAMTEHLLGLQAQETLPPYLSLAARIEDFDPRTLSAAIENRRVVRILSMRGTVHALSAADALTLRPWVQDFLDRTSASQVGAKPASRLPTADLYDAAEAALRDGLLPVADLAERLALTFADVPFEALRAACRARLPLVQVPPRGSWRRGGGVVYELLTSWLDAPEAGIDLPGLVRRYLRAYGPASASDLTAWSGVTRLGPVFAAMTDDLVEYRDERGRPLYDLTDGVLADPDLELPPRLLGNFDNLWLSHADRSRIATADKRRAWLGNNGGFGAGVFVDGMLEGTWRRDGDEFEVTPLRRFSKRERSGIDAEFARIRAFLDIGP